LLIKSFLHGLEVDFPRFDQRIAVLRVALEPNAVSRNDHLVALRAFEEFIADVEVASRLGEAPVRDGPLNLVQQVRVCYLEGGEIDGIAAVISGLGQIWIVSANGVNNLSAA
jgi:hypothetical protein